MKARVKPGNSYGWLPAGSVVEVEATELDRVPWCLEAVDDSAPLTADAPPVYPAQIDIPQPAPPIDQESVTAAAVTLPAAPTKKGKGK